MILIDNVTKKYKENVGNFNIKIKIDDGKTIGILGPNGAGKTTLIKQMLGFIKSDEGQINYDELEIRKNCELIMKSVGYVPGDLALYESYTGIAFIKMMYDLKNCNDWEYVEKLIKYFEIDTSRKIKKMSKGMKQKIAIISAIINKPKYLILDEPTSGLDPVMQKQFNNLILELKAKFNTTTFICSHIFGEIAKLCDEIYIIKDGVIIRNMKVDENSVKEIEKEFYNIFNVEEIF